MVPVLEGKNHDALVVATAEALTACTLILAYDTKKLPCSVQGDNCTCLLWIGCQAHVAQQISGAILTDVPHSVLKLPSDHRTQASSAPEPRCCRALGQNHVLKIKNHVLGFPGLGSFGAYRQGMQIGSDSQSLANLIYDCGTTYGTLNCVLYASDTEKAVGKCFNQLINQNTRGNHFCSNVLTVQ